MKKFMDDDFLLEYPISQQLYDLYAKGLPIIDYHCHVSAEEIACDKQYENPTQIMLSSDHYKWRMMRCGGIAEFYVTGNATDKEKFEQFASVLEKAIGNPIYHWTHMELKQYFGYGGILNTNSCHKVWDICCARLKDGNLSVRSIIEQSNVEVICTTDDPCNNLEYHKQCRKDSNLKVSVLPTFRPDKAVNIHKEGFAEYIERLAAVAGYKIETLDDLFTVMKLRMDFFEEQGCKIADHGLDKIVYQECPKSQVEAIFEKARKGQKVSPKEGDGYITALLLYCAEEYEKRGWVMQLHFGALRNTNERMYGTLGPDTGYDVMDITNCAEPLSRFLAQLDRNRHLPKTIIYSLNPSDNPVIDTIIGSFQGEECPGKVQHGAAWWFNDTKIGMEQHIQTSASLFPIGCFVGMLTDSRCFLSFSRHDYFRRILCNWVGGLVESGQYPNDQEALKKMIQGISYKNAKHYFSFGEE